MIATQLSKAISSVRFSCISRQIHSSFITNAAQTSPLYKLRQKTGLAYNLCREALTKHNNDVDEAEAWLKAQAMALGLQKAAKVGSRSTREGLIGLAMHANNQMATVVELNCETDFVAKNQIFKDFTIDVTQQVASIQNDCDVHQVPDQKFIQRLALNEQQMKSLNGQIAPMINKLGENIRIQRAVHFKVADDNSIKLFGQIHSKAGHKIDDGVEIMSGRFGAIVAVKDLSDSTRPIKGLGNRLCQHVIGFSPTYIELPDNIRKHLEEVEKEQLLRAKQELEEEKARKEESKNEDGQEGDQSDLEDNQTSNNNNRDDWPSIMDQQIILSDDQSVRDYCKENNVSIIYFNRFECGNDS